MTIAAIDNFIRIWKGANLSRLLVLVMVYDDKVVSAAVLMLDKCFIGCIVVGGVVAFDSLIFCRRQGPCLSVARNKTGRPVALLLRDTAVTFKFV